MCLHASVIPQFVVLLHELVIRVILSELIQSTIESRTSQEGISEPSDSKAACLVPLILMQHLARYTDCRIVKII